MAGQDDNLSDEVVDQYYWYSITDGYKLMYWLRKSYLKYHDNQQFESVTENKNGILITNPYYMDIFEANLKHDIDIITATDKGSDRKGWSAMPTTIIIPSLALGHWIAIKVGIDYEKKKSTILFDNPYGRLTIPDELKERIISCLHLTITKLIDTETRNQQHNFKNIELVIEDDQQRSCENSWDCGPITFSNIEYYIRVVLDYNGEIIYNRVPPYNKEQHKNMIKCTRENHFKQCCKLSVSGNRLDENKKSLKENLQKLKEKIKTLVKDDSLSDYEIYELYAKLKSKKATREKNCANETVEENELRDAYKEIETSSSKEEKKYFKNELSKDLENLKAVSTSAKNAMNQEQQNSQLINLLHEIGQKIDAVFRQDKTKSIVRNVHGYRNPSDSNHKNKAGAALDFVSLARLKNLNSAHNHECEKLLQNNHQQVLTSLQILVKKIQFILKNVSSTQPQKTLTECKELENSDLGFLRNIMCYYHDLKCIDELLFNLNDENNIWLESLNLYNKEDRYALGYFFVKIGETAKEISDFIKPEENKNPEDNLTRFLFGKLIEYRNEIKQFREVVMDEQNNRLLRMLLILNEVREKLKKFLNSIKTKLLTNENDKFEMITTRYPKFHTRYESTHISEFEKDHLQDIKVIIKVLKAGTGKSSLPIKEIDESIQKTKSSSADKQKEKLEFENSGSLKKKIQNILFYSKMAEDLKTFCKTIQEENLIEDYEDHKDLIKELNDHRDNINKEQFEEKKKQFEEKVNNYIAFFQSKGIEVKKDLESLDYILTKLKSKDCHLNQLNEEFIDIKGFLSSCDTSKNMTGVNQKGSSDKSTNAKKTQLGQLKEIVFNSEAATKLINVCKSLKQENDMQECGFNDKQKDFIKQITNSKKSNNTKIDKNKFETLVINYQKNLSSEDFELKSPSHLFSWLRSSDDSPNESIKDCINSYKSKQSSSCQEEIDEDELELKILQSCKESLTKVRNELKEDIFKKLIHQVIKETEFLQTLYRKLEASKSESRSVKAQHQVIKETEFLQTYNKLAAPKSESRSVKAQQEVYIFAAQMSLSYLGQIHKLLRDSQKLDKLINHNSILSTDCFEVIQVRNSQLMHNVNNNNMDVDELCQKIKDTIIPWLKDFQAILNLSNIGEIGSLEYQSNLKILENYHTDESSTEIELLLIYVIINSNKRLGNYNKVFEIYQAENLSTRGEAKIRFLILDDVSTSLYAKQDITNLIILKNQQLEILKADEFDDDIYGDLKARLHCELFSLKKGEEMELHLSQANKLASSSYTKKAICIHFGHFYYTKQCYDNAIENFNNCIGQIDPSKLTEPNDCEFLSQAYDGLSKAHNKKGEIELSKMYFEIYDRFMNDNEGNFKELYGEYFNNYNAMFHFNKAEFLKLNLKNYDEALKFYKEALFIFKNQNPNETLVKIYEGISECYNYSNDQESATEYEKKANALATKLK